MKLPICWSSLPSASKPTASRLSCLLSGIIIGVMAIVVMLSVGEGLYSGVSSQFSTLNLDVIRVIPGIFQLWRRSAELSCSSGACQVHR